MDLTRWGGGVLACQTHLPTLKVLWAISLVPLLMVFFIFPSSCKGEMKQYRRKRKGSPCFYRLILFVMVCGVPGYIISGITLAVLKLASPDNQGAAIGVDPLPTFLLFLNHLFQAVTAMTFQARKVQPRTAHAENTYMYSSCTPVPILLVS